MISLNDLPSAHFLFFLPSTFALLDFGLDLLRDSSAFGALGIALLCGAMPARMRVGATYVGLLRSATFGIYGAACWSVILLLVHVFGGARQPHCFGNSHVESLGPAKLFVPASVGPRKRSSCHVSRFKPCDTPLLRAI